MERFEFAPCPPHCRVLLSVVHCLTKWQGPKDVLLSSMEGGWLIPVLHHGLYMRYRLSTMTI